MKTAAIFILDSLACYTSISVVFLFLFYYDRLIIDENSVYLISTKLKTKIQIILSLLWPIAVYKIIKSYFKWRKY